VFELRQRTVRGRGLGSWPAGSGVIVVVVQANGWFVDPFGAHESRWFSAGAPTHLVRDGEQTDYDRPPAASWDGPLTAVDTSALDWDRGGDLRRADDGLPTPDEDLPPIDPRVEAGLSVAKTAGTVLDIVRMFF
jgi:hypothetical protein